MNIKGCLSSDNQDWCTPLDIYNLLIKYKFIDICPLHSKFDCFDLDNWFYLTYCNPPYNDISRFVDRGVVECRCNHNIVFFLVPARTDTQWFKSLYVNNASFYFFEGRLRFNESKSAPFPSMIAILDYKNDCPTFSYIFKVNRLKIIERILNMYKK